MKNTVRRPRPYRMEARARSAEATRVRILEATFSLHQERFLDEITLTDVAERAGVSVQTVIRRFGSRDGLVRAVGDHVFPRVAGVREAVRPGDIEAVLEALIPHYEEDGNGMIRLLALEERNAAVHEVLERGRDFHRAWLARVFSAFLPNPSAAGYRRRLGRFVVATDLLTWKILRREQGLSREETQQAMREMLEQLTATGPRAESRDASYNH
jgi:AcrR family transcriptional regulator